MNENWSFVSWYMILRFRKLSLTWLKAFAFISFVHPQLANFESWATVNANVLFWYFNLVLILNMSFSNFHFSFSVVSVVNSDSWCCKLFGQKSFAFGWCFRFNVNMYLLDDLCLSKKVYKTKLLKFSEGRITEYKHSSVVLILCGLGVCKFPCVVYDTKLREQTATKLCK